MRLEDREVSRLSTRFCWDFNVIAGGDFSTLPLLTFVVGSKVEALPLDTKRPRLVSNLELLVLAPNHSPPDD